MISNLPIALVLAVGSFILFSRLYKLNTSLLKSCLLVVISLVLITPALMFLSYYLIHRPDGIWWIDFRSLPGTEALSGLVGAPLGVAYVVLDRRSRIVGTTAIAALMVVAGMLLIVPFAKQIFLRIDYSRMQARWDNGICLQSAGSSCVPASCTTVVRLLGGNLTERELAERSGTCKTGTEIWYLKRALRRYGYDLEAQTAQSPKEIPAPAIIGCGEFGHVIVLMSKTADGPEIGDPLGFHERYSWDTFERRYHPNRVYFSVRRVGK